MTASGSNSFSQKSVPDDEAFDQFYQSIELDQVEYNKKELSIGHLADKERNNFVNILRNHNFTNKTHYDAFWFEKRKELPYLYNLCLMFFNIPTSSAYVERFFSICGVVN